MGRLGPGVVVLVRFPFPGSVRASKLRALRFRRPEDREGSSQPRVAHTDAGERSWEIW